MPLFQIQPFLVKLDNLILESLKDKVWPIIIFFSHYHITQSKSLVILTEQTEVPLLCHYAASVR